MISAQQMVPNTTSVKQIKTVSASVSSSQSPVDAKVQLTSSNAVSGTKFTSDDSGEKKLGTIPFSFLSLSYLFIGLDTQVDNVLNIVLPKRKLQTNRPTTATTWEVTLSPAISSNVSPSSKTPYWLRNSSPGPIQLSSLPPQPTVTLKRETQSTSSTTTHPTDTTSNPQESFQTAARFTRKPSVTTTTTSSTSTAVTVPLEGFLTGAGLVEGTESADITAPPTSRNTPTSTLPSSTTTSTTKSTPGTIETTIKVRTTPSTTTTSSTTTTTTTPTTSDTTTATRTTPMTVPPTAQVTKRVITRHPTIPVLVTSTVLPAGELDDTVVIDNADGVIKVQLTDIPRRFGGVVRVPAHSVIGGGRSFFTKISVTSPLKPTF
jgi:hypothetical protein